MQQGKKTGLFGSLVLLLLKGKSLLTLLKLGKVALTLSTMIISIGVYSRLYTWRFAIGFVVCILIHELGHVVVNSRYGLKQTAPMFIPFVGALIALKSFPDDPTIESESGAGGPIAGALAAAVCAFIGYITHNPFWYALAATGFIINLFNLIPIMQLDGAHIAAVFSPKVWNGVMLALLLIVIKAPVTMVWIILATNFMARISQPPSNRYQLARPGARLRMAFVYVALCVGLSYGINATSEFYGRERQPAFAFQRAVRRPQTAQPTTLTGDSTTGARSKANVVSHVSHPALTFPRPNTIYVVMGILGVMGLFGGILWTLASYLLVQAGGQRFGARFLAPAGAMLVLFVLAIAAEKILSVSWYDFMVTIGAYFAAVIAALIYAGWAASQSKRKPATLPYLLLLARCLGWAGAGGLFMAYAFNSWVTAGIVGVAGLVFLARYPWLAVSKAAEWASDMGNLSRAESLLRRALAFAPDLAIQAILWDRLTRLYLIQERGGAALEAQDAKEALLAASTATNPDLQNGVNNRTYQPTLHDLEQRASALLMLDRYEETLTCCERMLQGHAPGAITGPLRLLIVHMYLTRLALLREWGDEAMAQSDWCLRAAANLPPIIQARVHIRRAHALVMQGQAEAALQESRLAEKQATETHTQANAASAEAQAHLLAGNAQSAEKAMQRALRLTPANLQFRYWQGRVLLAQGRVGEGKTLLTELAGAFPHEHWGRAAKSALASAS